MSARFGSQAAVSILLLLLGAIVCTPVPSEAGRKCCPRHAPNSGPANEVVQEFPSAGPTQTAWRIRFAHGPGKGLYITGAWFKKTASATWMRVLWDARVSDIFVPYHQGSPRYYDLSILGFALEPANSADAGCCGVLLDEFVVKEVRDRGVLWKNDQQVRRGEELVLWATVDAANYNYIIQYSFRDDGSIGFRMAATAANLPSLPFEPHMHDALWRVDIDLNGFARDSAILARHSETMLSPIATDSAAPFNGGQEGSADWNDLELTVLRVTDTATTNSHGENISYDLLPLRPGTPRHLEPFAHHDFWVTRYRGTELAYSQVPSYVNGESVTDTDVVLWYVAPLHHHPRREDGAVVNGVWQGVALAMWGGFDLRPRDLFDGTPLYP